MLDWAIEDEKEVFEILKVAYDQGIRTWDTADMYSAGQSERFIGKFLKEYNIPRSTVTILTKVWAPMPAEGAEINEANMINRFGLSRKHIMDAVDESIERLGTYIDVYQIARLDDTTDKVEIMEALNDCVRSGKVRYIGASVMRATEFAQLQFIAEQRGLTKFISMQNSYSLIYREEEREMIPFCNDTGVGLIPWGTLATGMLCRPLKATSDSVRGSSMFQALMQGLTKFGDQSGDAEVINRVEEVANKRGVSMTIVALAWALSKGVCPVVGFNKPERVHEAVRAVAFKLSTEEISYLEEPYMPHQPTVHRLEENVKKVIMPWLTL